MVVQNHEKYLLQPVSGESTRTPDRFSGCFGERFVVRGKDTAETPEEKLFGPLLHDEVEKTVASLPDEFKWAVLLSDVEGLPYREIADIMGCPVGTVRSRLSRGRQLLRRQLWGYAKQNGYVHEDAAHEV
ncbi:MAG: hypothetical protein FJY97_05810 [candidate division Zixibacteria bacterium]|nr:hypothetical protein [candidate division Zixibacteria bacterium]